MKLGETIFELSHVSVRFEKHAVGGRSLKHALGALLSRNGGTHFHALSDISVTIREGEHVGLVGRNGAGKSTLLRVLARIVVPQDGCVTVREDLHVAPLLELGIGFQPDLTGRENCLLAGLLLGYTGTEMKERMSEINDFSGLGEFFDEPVKNYSSGMYARLAFALATDIEPEVLLVDEIFGVGDESFMRKCIVRMQRLMSAGRTTVLVSHNLDFLVTQCERIIWLDGGRIVLDGRPDAVVDAYRKRSELVLL